MVNILIMMIIVFLGLTLLYLFKRKSEFLRISIIILTFFIARVFFGLEWKFITGNLKNISFIPDFYLLLFFNFIFLSLIFIFGINFITKQNFKSIGWTKKRILKNIIIGLFIGGILFFLLTFNKTIKYENLIIAIFFSFFIASWQEENIFRGHLFGFLNKKYGSTTSLIYQALIYSIAHIGFYAFFPIVNLIFSLIFAFILGLIFGYLKTKTNSQIPAFISHGIIDIAILII